MGLSRKKELWKSLLVSVAPSETKTIDSIPLASVNGLKYVLRAAGNTKVNLREMVVSKHNGDISDAVYSRLGDSLTIDYNVLVIGSDVVLQAINNESFAIEVSAKKLII